MRRRIFLVIFILIFPIILKAQSLYKDALDFSLPSLNDEKVSLEDFNDKPLILLFWTTWCPYCRRAINLLNQKYDEIKGSGIEILGINIEEPKQKIEKFLEEYPIKFKILLDKDGKTAYTYRVLGIPYYVLIDKNKKIKFEANYLPKDYKEILKD